VHRLDRLAELTDPLRVATARRVDLERDFDPRYLPSGIDKDDSARLLGEGVDLLADLQPRLAAQDTYGLLVVLQGIDGGGKDGTIRHVLTGVNPQGVRVSSFKVPSVEELDHDYLRRYAVRLPARGEIGIFNRSHYEEVLVVRVHPDNLDREKLPPEAKADGVWHRRYREINDWERYLSANGFKIVKLFLNLSKEEQRRRFLRRIDLPDHNWKFSAADIAERHHWDAYRDAFSEMLSHTSTDWAPWWVIPADRKWFAHVAAAAVIGRALAELDPRFPVPDAAERAALQQARAELEEEGGVLPAGDEP
jgi:PPK2 family polyphosphate:nucleotide phosphotransferase